MRVVWLLGVEGLRIATFNVLAPVHKSAGSVREAASEALWGPRARRSVRYISEALRGVEVICLQEFWFDEAWMALFCEGLETYALVSARRSGVHPHDGSRRSDGVATLIRRSAFRVDESRRVELEDGRVGLVVSLRRRDGSSPRLVVANVHLPFPSDAAASASQTAQVSRIARVVDAMSSHSTLGVVAGDFNCCATDPAALALESQGWTNCAAAHAAAELSSGVGGVNDLGVTHRTHTGHFTRCDHLFARDYSPHATQQSGYFDRAGLALASVARCHPSDSVAWDPSFNISDHLPVIAEFAAHPAPCLDRLAPDDLDDAWAPAPFPDTIC